MTGLHSRKIQQNQGAAQLQSVTVADPPGHKYVIPNLLSIAGFDPSGGAGAAADLKTFAALGCNGMAVITALTAENTQGVKAMHVPPADFAATQIDAIFGDIDSRPSRSGCWPAARSWRRSRKG